MTWPMELGIFRNICCRRPRKGNFETAGSRIMNFDHWGKFVHGQFLYNYLHFKYVDLKDEFKDLQDAI